ncbi:MAG TPA: hypothetical protein VF852_08060, partial [Pseudolabrys sp.]
MCERLLLGGISIRVDWATNFDQECIRPLRAHCEYREQRSAACPREPYRAKRKSNPAAQKISF